MARVLVVEDERKILRSLERGLEAEGYEVVAAADGDEAARQALTQPFDCVVLDLMLPGRDGLQVLKDLPAHGVAKPALILTSWDALEGHRAWTAKSLWLPASPALSTGTSSGS